MQCLTLPVLFGHYVQATDADMNCSFLDCGQHCLIDNERKETLTSACKIFKDANSLWSEIQGVVIDKDVTEISALRAASPQARLLLCPWHEKKYLYLEAAKAKYGFDAFEKAAVKSNCDALIAAPSAEKYDDRLASLRVIVRDKQKLDAWFEYFDPNWANCKEMWCSYMCSNVPHLGNNTNNR